MFAKWNPELRKAASDSFSNAASSSWFGWTVPALAGALVALHARLSVHQGEPVRELWSSAAPEVFLLAGSYILLRVALQEPGSQLMSLLVATVVLASEVVLPASLGHESAVFTTRFHALVWLVVALLMAAARAVPLVRRRDDPCKIWAIVWRWSVCTAAAVMVIQAVRVAIHPRDLSPLADVHRLAPVAGAASAVALSVPTLRRIGIVVAGMLLVVPGAAMTVAQWIGVSQHSPFEPVDLVLMLALVAAALGFGRILTPRFDVSEGRVRQWLILVLVLNVVDSAATHVAIRLGKAEEANPLVDILGLGPKTAVVTVAAIALYAVRPQALRIPAVALAAVTLWHLGGVWISG